MHTRYKVVILMNKIRVDFEIQKRKHGGSCPQQKPNLEKKKKGNMDKIKFGGIVFCITNI